MSAETTVLVADDERLVHSLIKDILSDLPFRLVHAFSGDEAAELIQSGHIDLLFTDIMMPGMNGLDLVEWTVQNFPNVLCIITTALPDRELIKQALRLGVFDYIDKPYKATELRETLLAAAQHHAATTSALAEFEQSAAEVRAREQFLTDAEDKILSKLNEIEVEMAEVEQKAEDVGLYTRKIRLL